MSAREFADDVRVAAKRRRIFGMVGGANVVPEAAAAARKFFVPRLKNRRLVVGKAGGARPLN